MTTHEILLAAQAAKLPLALADTDTKNAALEAMAVALVENSDAFWPPTSRIWPPHAGASAM